MRSENKPSRVSKTRSWRRSKQRPGTIYILVLSVSMMIAGIGLAALYGLRVQRRSQEIVNDAGVARSCAQAAVELGLYYISSDTTWRNNRVSGTWLSDQSLGQGTFSLTGIDPNDGDLQNSELDAVILTGIGNYRYARQKIQVQLVPDEIQGLDCLTAALHVGGNLSLTTTNETLDVNDTLVSCNGLVTNNGTISGDVDANAINDTGTITGTVSSPVTDKEMPDNTELFAYYQGLGTSISILSIPSGTGTYTIEDQYLASTYNPYGTYETNTRGIYVIDCKGWDLHIRNSHIDGTLVLLNAGASSLIEGSMYWEQSQTDPATGAQLPTLLVQGDMTLGLMDSELQEETLPIDLNNDGDTVDVWPSIISGLIYISGQLTATTGNQNYAGTVIVGGDCDLSNTQLSIDYQSTFFENPPYGWIAPIEMKIATGSWEKVVD